MVPCDNRGQPEASLSLSPLQDTTKRHPHLLIYHLLLKGPRMLGIEQNLLTSSLLSLTISRFFTSFPPLWLINSYISTFLPKRESNGLTTFLCLRCIFTTTLQSRSGWRCLTCPRPFSVLLAGIQTWFSQIVTQHLNHYISILIWDTGTMAQYLIGNYYKTIGFVFYLWDWKCQQTTDKNCSNVVSMWQLSYSL